MQSLIVSTNQAAISFGSFLGGVAAARAGVSAAFVVGGTFRRALYARHDETRLMP